MERHDKKVFLDLNHVFGINTQFKNALSILQQDHCIKLIYTAGKTIVKYTINNQKMEFIKLTETIESIECLSISPSRAHIAVCQKLKNENFLLLNLYGIRNKDTEIKHFKLPQTQKQSSFKAIAFAPSQTKYACCLTGQPDYQLIFLDVSRSRGLAVSNFSVDNAQTLAICPSQSHLISCSGKNLFKLFKVQDYTFKTIEDIKKLPKTRNFTTHAWFDKAKILIGTDRGELFMVGPVGNNFEVKRHFANVFGIDPHDLKPQTLLPETSLLTKLQERQGKNQVSVTAICVFSKGFILGSSQGHFSLWIKQDESEENFQDEYTGDLTKKWKVPTKYKSQVVSIAICPQQQVIAVLFSNHTIAYTTIQKLKENLSNNIQVTVQEQNNNLFTFLYGGFHNQGVSCMDVCLHRPILATLSKQQNTVRLWNYKTPSCQLIKKFDSKIDGIEQTSSQLLLCLALHPLGYYMAIGCCDKLRIYHILHKQLRNYRQIVLKSVCQLKFSNGGHMLAAAYPRQKYNIHQINVYNAYTLEQIGRLSDHSNLITDLCWRPYDRSLISVGIDGTVSQWKQAQNKAETKQWLCKKWSQNNSRYTSVMFQKAVKSILVAGVQGPKAIIREIRTQKDQPQKLNTLGFKITKLKWLTSQWNIPAILAGTQQGHLKVFNSSFDNIVEQSMNIHNKQITKVEASPCGRYVFTTGQDGNLFIFQVSLANRQGYMNKRLHENVNEYELNPMVKVLDDQLASIVLVQRNDVNEKIRYIKMLQKNMEQMKRKLIIQDQQNKRKHETNLSQLSNQKQKQIDDLNLQLQRLKSVKKDLQINTQASYLQLQNKNAKMLEDIEALYQKKLAIENKKYFQLQTSYQNILRNNSEETNKTKEKYEDSMQLLKQQFLDTFKKAQKIHENKQRQVVNSEKNFLEKVNQVQQEHQQQLNKLGKKLNYLEEQKTQKTAEYKNSISSLQREIKIISQQIVKSSSENDQLTQSIKDLQRQLKDIRDNILNKKAQLLQKQQTLKQKQQNISQYQQRISDLQKKKQILSYRTWQMRQQIQPKQDEIDFLKNQLFGLEKQFETLLTEEKVLKQTHTKLKKEKQRLNKLLSEQKMNTRDKQAKLKKIYNQINGIVQHKNVEKGFYEQQMKRIFDKYSPFMTDGIRLSQGSKGEDQMTRHRQHLQKQIKDVQFRVQRKMNEREDEIQKITQDNFELISKVSILRQEKRKLQDQLTSLDKIAQSIKRQAKQIRQSALTSAVDPPMSIYKKPSQKTLTSSLKQVMIRSNSQPLKKGKIVKGLNYDNDSLSIFARAKVKQLQNRLQSTKSQYMQKQMLVKILKSKVYDHIQEENCHDLHLEKCLTDYQ